MLITELAHLALPLSGHMYPNNSQQFEHGRCACSHSRPKNRMAVVRAIPELPGPGWLAAEPEKTPSNMAVNCQHLPKLMADELKKLELF